MLSTLTQLFPMMWRPRLRDEVIAAHKTQARVNADTAAAHAKHAATHSAVATATASEISDRYPNSSDAREADAYATAAETAAASAASFATAARTAANTAAVCRVQVELAVAAAASALEKTKKAAVATRASAAAVVVVLARCVARVEGRPFALPLTQARSKKRPRAPSVTLPVKKPRMESSDRDKSPASEETPSPAADLDTKLIALKEHYVGRMQALVGLWAEKKAIMGRYHSDLVAVRQCLPPEYGIYTAAAVKVVEESKDAALGELWFRVEELVRERG